MTPEEYRKKVDPCVNLHLSFEAVFLTCDTDREKKEENPMEITHALYTDTHIIVILSSNEGISPGVSLIQNGTEWYIEKKTEEGNGWILKGSSIRMPTPKTGPVEVKQNFHFGAMARLGDQKILVHRGDARLPDDVKVGDVFQALFHSHPACWMVTGIFQDTIITESLSHHSHRFARRNIPVKRILGIPITITEAIRFAGAIMASIKGIDQTLLNHGYIEQDGPCWAISETLSFPLAVGVSLRYDSEDPEESMATAPVPKPGPATFKFNRP